MPPGGIRTHDLSRRAAADLRLRLRGHWDRQPVPIHKLNAIKTANELRLIRPQTLHKKPEKPVFKILTTINTICGENCEIFMGLRKFINRGIKMYYLVSVDRNIMAAHLNRNDSEGF